MNPRDRIYNLTLRAYSGDSEAGEIPAEQKTRRTSLLEEARQGYLERSREQELKRPASRQPLKNVLGLIGQGSLPKALRPLAERPPTREEAQYLPVDVQRLADDLITLDKAVDGIPAMEAQLEQHEKQKRDWTEEAIRLGIADKSQKAGGIEWPLEMESTQRILGNLRTEKAAIMRGTSAFMQNNPGAMESAIDKLGVLRTELQAPMPYMEAKSGLQPKSKPASEWLRDLKVKGSFEERQEAKSVLDAGGIDSQGILREVELAGMSPVDRVVAEAKDRETGKATPKQAQQARQPEPTKPETTLHPESDRIWQESLETEE